LTLKEDEFEFLDGIIREGILEKEKIVVFVFSKNVDKYLKTLEKLVLLHTDIRIEPTELTEEELELYGDSKKIIIKEKGEAHNAFPYF
jgi:hypothetical protein